MFMIGLVYSILVQRNRFVPVGWTKKYDFNDSDLFYSAELISQLFPNSQHIDPCLIPWNQIRKTLFHSVFGARLETEDDLNILDRILFLCLVPECFVPGFSVGDLILPECVSQEKFLEWTSSQNEMVSAKYVLLPPSIDKLMNREREAKFAFDMFDPQFGSETNEISEIYQEGIQLGSIEDPFAFLSKNRLEFSERSGIPVESLKPILTVCETARINEATKLSGMFSCFYDLKEEKHNDIEFNLIEDCYLTWTTESKNENISIYSDYTRKTLLFRMHCAEIKPEIGSAIVARVR